MTLKSIKLLLIALPGDRYKQTSEAKRFRFIYIRNRRSFGMSFVHANPTNSNKRIKTFSSSCLRMVRHETFTRQCRFIHIERDFVLGLEMLNNSAKNEYKSEPVNFCTSNIDRFKEPQIFDFVEIKILVLCNNSQSAQVDAYKICNKTKDSEN